MLRKSQMLFFAATVTLAAWTGAASEPVYDEKADAPQQVAAAVAAAGPSRKHVVLAFGANWCADCRALDAQMHQPELAALLEENFLVVKIDVGRMDKNLELAGKYGVPVRRGIPALAVLDAQGKLLCAQDQGEFADARHLSLQSIKAFFDRWKPKP